MNIPKRLLPQPIDMDAEYVVRFENDDFPDRYVRVKGIELLTVSVPRGGYYATEVDRVAPPVPLPRRVHYTGPMPRECFECGGYGFHFDYCDKVM